MLRRKVNLKELCRHVNLTTVIRRLAEAGLQIKKVKCYFSVDAVEYLRFGYTGQNGQSSDRGTHTHKRHTGKVILGQADLLLAIPTTFGYDHSTTTPTAEERLCTQGIITKEHSMRQRSF